MSVFMQMMIWIVIHDIDPDVAELLKKRLGEKLNPEKFKEIVAKHKRPANCPELKPIRVNPEIWGQLTPTQKRADLNLTNFQQLVRKVTIINLQTTDWLASNTQNNTDLITKSVDSIAMLGHLNTQLAQLRRDQIQPALKPEYKQICAIEVPANSQTKLWVFAFSQTGPHRAGIPKQYKC